MKWEVNNENRLYSDGKWLGEICGELWLKHEQGKTNALNRLLHILMWAKEDVAARIFSCSLLKNLTLSSENIYYGLLHLDVLWALEEDGASLPTMLRMQVKSLWQTWEDLYLGVNKEMAFNLEEKKESVQTDDWWGKFLKASRS